MSGSELLGFRSLSIVRYSETRKHNDDDTFVVWPHGPELLQNFLSHLNSSGRIPLWMFWSSGKGGH
jgi:hypothetical protein